MDAVSAKIEYEISENQFRESLDSVHLLRNVVDPLHVIGITLEDDTSPQEIRNKYK